MRLDLNLPHIKLSGIIFEDEVFRYDGYRLEAWKGDIQKLNRFLETAAEMFFQDEMLIDKDILEQVELDIEYVTFEFANLLFNNLEKAVAVWNATNKEYRFDEMKVTWENYGDSTTFEVGGTEYAAYYEDELMATAKELYTDYMRDGDLADVIGSLKYMSDYFDVINTADLASEIRKELDDRDLTEYLSDETLNDDIKLIKAFIDMDSDYETEDFIWDTIDNEELFDYWKYTDQSILDASDALDHITGMMGDLVYEGKTVLSGWKPQTVWVLERY